MAPRPIQPCGTYAAYRRHRHRGEEPCGPCRAAAQSRAAGRYERVRLDDRWRVEMLDRQRARRRARAALVAEYPGVYARLLAEIGRTDPARRALARRYPQRYAELACAELAVLTFGPGGT